MGRSIVAMVGLNFSNGVVGSTNTAVDLLLPHFHTWPCNKVLR
jgi:hypothetical protein